LIQGPSYIFSSGRRFTSLLTRILKIVPGSLSMKFSLAEAVTFLLVAGTAIIVHQVVLRETTQSEMGNERPLLEVISSATHELTQLAQAKSAPSASQRAAHLLGDIDVAYSALATAETAEEAEIHQARQSVLIARYAAVSIDRTRFLESFEDYAGELRAKHSSSAAAIQAEMLQLLVRHDLSQPPDRKFVDDIEAFAATHQPKQGAVLYCLAAEELVRNQQLDAAKEMIRQGLKAYQTTPLALSMLVNQSANLGLSKPPPPSKTNLPYHDLAQSYESLGRYIARQAAKNFCGPRRR
jgi:hypothetical protein